MATAIIYESTHHGNTEKLVQAIAAKHDDVVLIDARKKFSTNMRAFDVIGFASGISYGKFYPEIMKVMEEKMPQGAKVFLLYTCGNMRNGYTDGAKKIIEAKEGKYLGSYGCLGFDTYGIFKVMGGIAKGHPTEKDIDGAVKFYEKIV